MLHAFFSSLIMFWVEMSTMGHNNTASLWCVLLYLWHRRGLKRNKHIQVGSTEENVCQKFSLSLSIQRLKIPRRALSLGTKSVIPAQDLGNSKILVLTLISLCLILSSFSFPVFHILSSCVSRIYPWQEQGRFLSSNKMYTQDSCNAGVPLILLFSKISQWRVLLFPIFILYEIFLSSPFKLKAWQKFAFKVQINNFMNLAMVNKIFLSR